MALLILSIPLLAYYIGFVVTPLPVQRMLHTTHAASIGRGAEGTNPIAAWIIVGMTVAWIMWTLVLVASVIVGETSTLALLPLAFSIMSLLFIETDLRSDKSVVFISLDRLVLKGLTRVIVIAVTLSLHLELL